MASLRRRSSSSSSSNGSLRGYRDGIIHWDDASAAALVRTSSVESLQPERLKMVGFLGRGTCEALLSKVCASMQNELTYLPFNGPTSSAAPLLLQEHFDIAFFASYGGYEKAIEAVGAGSFVNRLPGFNELCQKDTLTDILMASPRGRACIPQTLVLPRDLHLMKSWAAERPPDVAFILKPSQGAKGADIVVIPSSRSLNLVIAALRENPSTSFILQEYVQRPRLIAGRKFDLR